MYIHVVRPVGGVEIGQEGTHRAHIQEHVGGMCVYVVYVYIYVYISANSHSREFAPVVYSAWPSVWAMAPHGATPLYIMSCLIAHGLATHRACMIGHYPNLIA